MRVPAAKKLLPILAVLLLVVGLSIYAQSPKEADKNVLPTGLASTSEWTIFLLRSDDGFYRGEFEAARAGILAALEPSKKGGFLGKNFKIVELSISALPPHLEASSLALGLFAGPENDRLRAASWAESVHIPLFILNDGKCFTASASDPNRASPYLYMMGLTIQSTLEPLLIHLNEKFSHPDKDFGIYFFGGDTPENRGLIQFAQSQSEALGFKTIASRFDDIRLADYYSVVRNIIVDGPDVLFFANPQPAGQLFLEQALKLRLDKEMQLASLNSFDSELFEKNSEILVGGYTASKYTSGLSNVENSRFLEELKKLNLSKAILEGSIAEAAYASLRLFTKAHLRMEKEKLSLDDAMADLELEAPNGLMRMNSKNHVVEQALFIVRREKDSWKIVESLGVAVHPGLEGCASDSPTK